MDNRFTILDYFYSISKKLDAFDTFDIENSLLGYIVKKHCLTFSLMPFDFVERILKSKHEIEKIFFEYNFPTELETVIEFFEFLTDDMLKTENGIVFTPKYISDFIVADSLCSVTEYSNDISIIDPSCGCGIFLISAIEYISKKFSIPIPDVISNNIYGIDIIKKNVSRCRDVLLLLCLYNGYTNPPLKINIKVGDSLDLENSWTLDKKEFNYIIGNPPYINTHDMNYDTIQYLKTHYSTTRKGVFNIFYAFIERSLGYISNDGCIEFIVPNNFLTIKSAEYLRGMLQSNHCLLKLIDFANNMVFKPVRTYNCIVKLAKYNNMAPFEYCVLPNVSDIKNALSSIRFNSLDDSKLDINGWKLVDNVTLENINKIENQGISLKNYIRTGIATLKDSVYLVSKNDKGFYKYINGTYYTIESSIVKPIYKISDLKKCLNPSEAMKYIIFPYTKGEKGYIPYQEQDIQERFPNTYKYLLEMRFDLDSRDKGKKSVIPWFAFGRTQGLNKYGKKLVFPTFSKQPNFFYIDNEDALFCNGYAIFENLYYSLELVKKILNSKIMQYYISKTSYAIEGEFFCYQKKYIERFSLPRLNEKEIQVLQEGSSEEIDKMLINAYSLKNI